MVTQSCLESPSLLCTGENHWSSTHKSGLAGIQGGLIEWLHWRAAGSAPLCIRRRHRTAGHGWQLHVLGVDFVLRFCKSWPLMEARENVKALAAERV